MVVPHGTASPEWEPRVIPGGRYAFQIVHPASPVLRIRYRDGIPVGPHGFPDWIPYTRAVVRLPPCSPDLGVDEARVVDVLTANNTMAASGDPLWAGLPAGATPAGWTWAHMPLLLSGPRWTALVPVELHGAYRHLGGVSTGRADRARRGLPAEGGAPPRIRFTQRLSDEVMEKVEERLGYGLPAGYRSFLRRTNGGCPAVPAVHPGFGFVVDQPFFGVARQDRLQDLVYANAWFGDRITPDFLATGYVQGGLIAVRVRGGDEGSIWYWDDDDPRDTDTYTAGDVCERLLHRCADDFVAFWQVLTEPPPSLRELAAHNPATVVVSEGMGVSLPASRRVPSRSRAIKKQGAVPVTTEPQ
ncbi:cell wall assembly/cell proliferation coordinating protein [Candidatus Protofrankia californiensis]|uniref:Cell wall assembly/cell proliferation coordinating protein n=1 Tax=Candidatus Protofrankia californiensis TaxID=1839754 RepID=A0A1C3NWX7_9ACTN|nr:cell wall assembly/cell proliferation coordinating protein [Candidatus Protofrankia californiensis]